MWKRLPSVASVLAFALLALSPARGEQDWWENGNFYQIYPRSFQDSDGDGIGDLNGVTEHLDYLAEIGMDGVWLSPIFKSPMADFGYDISDYYQIQPEYGNVADMERLLERAHELGLHIILDFVPNHTSDEHEWFQRSVAGDPEYADYYIWHDGVVDADTGERRPPCNWVSAFRGSAWQWVEERQQYYLHQFAIKQPDLNYRNPAVRQAVKDVMQYWLGKGVDGFRIDAVNFFYEVQIDPQTGTYPDEPVIADVSQCPDPEDWCHLNHIYTKDKPENIVTIYEWRSLMDDWKALHGGDTKVLLTEAYTRFSDLMALYGNGERNGSNVPFNFEMLSALNNQSSASDYSYYINHWLENMPAGVYANWVLGNHDNSRLASRFGVQRTDLMNILLQTLPGIAVTFNGEEYGMEDVYISWEDTVDVQGCNTNPQIYQQFSRDPERTPFRWNSSANAGFSSAAKTWLPVGDGYETNNVAVQLAAENSHLQIFKRATAIRKVEPAFSEGNYQPVVVGDVLLYKRQAASGDAFLVVLNIGDSDAVLDLWQYYDDIAEGASVEVAISSLQSGFDVDEAVSATAFVALAYNAYVLRLI